MTDYTKLIRSLRNCSNNRCTPCDCGWFDKYQVDESCKEIIMWKAAAAIEDMAKHITEMHERVTVLQIARVELEAEVEKERTAECWGCKCEKVEPKRGEWIVDGMYTYNLRELNGKAYEPVYRCSCCNRQMESYLRLDEPKMPEDADFPEYCPHCGAKMEVQDG